MLWVDVYANLEARLANIDEANNIDACLAFARGEFVIYLGEETNFLELRELLSTVDTRGYPVRYEVV